MTEFFANIDVTASDVHRCALNARLHSPCECYFSRPSRPPSPCRTCRVTLNTHTSTASTITAQLISIAVLTLPLKLFALVPRFATQRRIAIALCTTRTRRRKASAFVARCAPPSSATQELLGTRLLSQAVLRFRRNQRQVPLHLLPRLRLHLHQAQRARIAQTYC